MHLFVAFTAMAAFLPIQENGPTWIIDLVRQAETSGLLSRYLDGLHHGNPYTRYELAVKVYYAVHSAENVIKRLETDPAVRPGFADWLAGPQLDWCLMGKAATELGRELTSIGTSVEPLVKMTSTFKPRLGQLWFTTVAPAAGYPSFPDVPKGHWAAKSLSHLRAVGVINGYPTGKFLREPVANPQ
jgi:hypothetical protein